MPPPLLHPPTPLLEALAEQLARLWPAMPERLGERYPSFIASAVQHARDRGLSHVVDIARYANLWVVWGPAFHDKPAHAWAQALLAPAARALEEAADSDPAEVGAQAFLEARRAAVGHRVMHQLLRRSQLELARLPGARIEVADLETADRQLCAHFSAWRIGGPGPSTTASPPHWPRQACDLEAAEIRLIDGGAATPQATASPAHLRYEWQQGGWVRVGRPGPAPLRISLGQPCPPVLHLLAGAPPPSDPAGDAAFDPLAGVAPRGDAQPPTPDIASGTSPATTRLLLRLRAHATCTGDGNQGMDGATAHPSLSLAGPWRRWHCSGSQTHAVELPVVARRVEPAPSGAGSLIAEISSPEYYRLDLTCCGLRDEGEVLGSQQTRLTVWPADQWLMDLRRDAPPVEPVALPPGAPALPVFPALTTLCRVERDGQALSGRAVSEAFRRGLDGQVAVGLQRLLADWAALPGLASPRLDARLALLCGRAGFSWGWQAPALDRAAQMRVQGELELQAGLANLQLQGLWRHGGSHTRMTLVVQGQEALHARLALEAAAPGLDDGLLGLKRSFRWPFRLELEPQAEAGAALLLLEAPVSGALVGEAGLRPCSSGRSGWVWYARLRLEPVQARLRRVDPLLGDALQTHTLLPAATLVDWSLA